MQHTDATPHPQAPQRNVSLDGLRGIAIALVVLFHAYVRWPTLVPYGDRFSHVPVLAQGRVGVNLFFLISGFVIFMTLERSSGFVDFIKRRWLRLWPAMFAVSVFLFATAGLFTRPYGSPILRDLLPGLTFVEPAAWSWLLGSPQGVLEGAFWTLFVEMKFYVVVSALFFTVGTRGTFAALVSMFLAPYVVQRIPAIAPGVNAAASFLDSTYWGWFAAGALYFKAQRARWLLIPALALSLFAALKTGNGITIASLIVALLFGVAQVSRRLQAVLSLRVFVFAGAISYPLYLVHENMLVSMIGTVGRVIPFLPAVLVPVLPISIVVGIGWVVATYVEPAVRNVARNRSLRLTHPSTL